MGALEKTQHLQQGSLTKMVNQLQQVQVDGVEATTATTNICLNQYGTLVKMVLETCVVSVLFYYLLI